LYDEFVTLKDTIANLRTQIDVLNDQIESHKCQFPYHRPNPDIRPVLFAEKQDYGSKSGERIFAEKQAYGPTSGERIFAGKQDYGPTSGERIFTGKQDYGPTSGERIPASLLSSASDKIPTRASNSYYHYYEYHPRSYSYWSPGYYYSQTNPNHYPHTFKD
jgi:hypothetical protein